MEVSLPLFIGFERLMSKVAPNKMDIGVMEGLFLRPCIPWSSSIHHLDFVHLWSVMTASFFYFIDL